MPTMVHTRLVRVGSIVCSARVGSTSAGATSGWAGSELSAGSCSGLCGCAFCAHGPSLLFRTIVAANGRSRHKDTGFWPGQRPTGPGVF